MFVIVNQYKRMLMVAGCLVTVMIALFLLVDTPYAKKTGPKVQGDSGRTNHICKISNPPVSLPVQDDGLSDSADSVQQAPSSAQATRELLEPVPSERKSHAKDSEDIVLVHGNQQLNLTNVLLFWTDGEKLKVVNLVVLNQDNQRMGVLTIPLGAQVRYKNYAGSLSQYYYRFGRAKFQSMLEAKLENIIDYYISIDQDTVLKLSDHIGVINVQGERIDFYQACEQNVTGKRADAQEVIRSFADTIMEPNMWWKLPKLIWLLTSEVVTDFSGTDLLNLYDQTKDMKIDQLAKRTIPVFKRSVRVNNTDEKTEQYTEVKDIRENTWANALVWLTVRK